MATGSHDVACVRVVIHGRVQGVWFRGWTMQEARARGLSGWVRNRRDGTVEAVFEGPGDAVEAMIAACAKGPPAARVLALERFPHTETIAPGFEARPTV